MTLYGVLKLVHVLAVIVWIGGGAALAAVTWTLTGARDRGTLSGFLPRAQRYGVTMGAPAAILVLLTGASMIPVGRVQGSVWIAWGYAGILLHFVFQIAVVRRRAARLSQVLATPGSQDAQLADAGSSLRTATLIHLLLMTSVIVVMVLKPTL